VVEDRANGLRFEDINKVPPTPISFEATIDLVKKLSGQCEILRSFSHSKLLSDYSDKVIILEHQLGVSIHHYLKHQGRNNSLLESETIQEAFYLSAYMFDLAILRERPTLHHNFAIVLRRIVFILTTINRVSDVFSNMVLFWTLFNGSVLGEDGSEESFFQEQLQTVALDLNVKSWDDAKEVLQKIAWVPRCCEERWGNVWNKIIHGQEARKRGLQLKGFQRGWNNFHDFVNEV
jgi:hypothetical protein